MFNKITEKMSLTKTEKSILLQIHLQGFWGKSGNLTVSDRRKYIYNLIDRGYLSKKPFGVTQKAINEIA